MLVGEWGAYGRNPGTLPAGMARRPPVREAAVQRDVLGLRAGHRTLPVLPDASSARTRSASPGRCKAITTIPILAFSTCTWQEDGDITAPSRIYLPDWFTFDETKLELTPRRTTCKIIETSSNSGSHYLEIPPTGEIVYAKLWSSIKRNRTQIHTDFH